MPLTARREIGTSTDGALPKHRGPNAPVME